MPNSDHLGIINIPTTWLALAHEVKHGLTEDSKHTAATTLAELILEGKTTFAGMDVVAHPDMPRGAVGVPADPFYLVVDYGRAGEKRYVLRERTRTGKDGRVMFQDDSKSTVIAESQRIRGWPVDGSEATYARQIAETRAR